MAYPRSLVISLSIMMLAISSYSFWKKSAQSPQAPEILYGIPVYPQSTLNLPLSSNGDPHIFVFLSDDSLENVLRFYNEAFKAEPRVLSYGKGAMTIYQYLVLSSDLTNYPLKGVEVMPYNAFYRRVMNKKVKIKIYVPKAEVEGSESSSDE